MMWIELFTWAAIVVLIAGSIAVFAWFLADARRLLAETAADRADDDVA